MFVEIKKRFLQFHVLSFVIIACYITLTARQIVTNSVTFDEPAHIRSGLEWLVMGYSPSDPFNPPLSKIPFGILQILGFHLQADPYLRIARFTSVSITAFFFLYFYFWTKKIFSQTIALIALFFLVCEPTVLAYTHLAATEAVTMLSCFFVFSTGIDAYRKPSIYRLCIFLFSLFLLYCTKTVFLLAFLPLFLIITLKYKQIFSRAFILPLLLTLCVCVCFLLLITGGHAYPLGGITFPGGGIIKTTLLAASFVFNPKYTPTRSFIFFGSVYHKGFYIYPFIAFLLKTSPQVILLFGWFLLNRFYKKSSILLFALITIISFFAVVVIGNYNIGQRHILSVFPFIAILIAYATYTLFQATKNVFLRYSMFFIIGIACVFSAVTQDTIAYITPAIGSVVGGNIIGDSNFDWGQSIPLLAREYPNIDYVATSSVASPVWYGIYAKPLFSKTNNKELLGKQIAISRSAYIKEKYSKSPFFAEKNATYIVNGTFLLFHCCSR